VLADLQGGSPIDDNDPSDDIPDVVDPETLQERTKGDEAFVEELQEKLRPLCVLIHTASARPH